MVHVLRWSFFKTVPNPQESTSDYVNRLVNLAVDCDFEHLSIKGAIMQNLLAHSMSPYLRQVVLDEELSIDQTISWTKKLEEKCQAEIALLKLELKNQNSEENCEDVEVNHPKVEVNDDQLDEFVKFDEDINDDHIDNLDNFDQMDEDVFEDEQDNDCIQTSDNGQQKASNIDPPDYKCKISDCNKEFRHHISYKRHMAKDHNLGLLKFKCKKEDCNVEFNSSLELKKHLKKHEPIKQLDGEKVPDFKLVQSKRNSSNPGILIIQGYKYYCNTISKRKNDGQRTFIYCCSEKETGYKCSAMASITTVRESDQTCKDVSKNILTRWPSIDDHSHDPDIGSVIVNEMILEMEEIVTNNPTKSVSNIKTEIMAEYELKHPTLWDAVLTELGKRNKEYIDRRLRRIREKLIGRVQVTLIQDPSVQNLAEKMLKEMEERVEVDPTIQLLKIHDDVFNSYESEFGHQEIWPKVILALGKVRSRLQRLRKVRTKLLGDLPTSMFIYSKSREKVDNI